MPPIQESMTTEEQALLDADRNATPAETATEAAGTPSDAQVEAATDTAAQTGEGAPAAPADGDKAKLVPIGALHEERQRRKDLDAALAAEKQARQTLEQRTNILLERIGQQQQPAQPNGQQQQAIPDIGTDPVGHILARQAQAEAVLREIVTAVAGREQQTQVQGQANAMMQRAAALERQFASENPDYNQALTHLMDSRRADLAEAGWTDPAEVDTMLAAEARGLAARALQLGRNPAEMAYNMAKKRGFAPPSGNGAAAAPAANAEQQLRNIARGQQQAPNLRGSSSPPLTAQKLLELSDAEFSKMLDTPQGRELMGS
jgi:hypothetical protein